MQRILILVLALTMLIAGATMAARVATTPKVHVIPVFQVCEAESPCTCFAGYTTSTQEVIEAAPGILCIDPGGFDWPNFVQAAQVTGQSWTIKNVTLVKVTPPHVQCKERANGDLIFPEHTVTQQGTPNIRKWWPLMYEIPSTTFTLTILYGTPNLFDDDGPTGPNPPAWVHVEQWVWHVEATLDSLDNLLELFHELPFGLDEVPLISDEDLFEALDVKVDAAEDAFEAGDLATAAEILADFELEVMDACIDDSPSFPNPTGPGTGIANSDENPACCKLLIDVEYILQTTGIGQQKK